MSGELADLLTSNTSVPLWPTAGKAVGLGRNATYEAAKRGEIPTNRFGNKITVPTAPLRRMLGIDTDTETKAA